MEPGRPHAVLDLLVTPERARHTEETNPTALRIQVGEKTMCYTGDTEWTDDIARAARDTDLLIAESYFYDKPVKWHLNYPDIVAHAGRVGATAADPHPHEPRDAGAGRLGARGVRPRRARGHPLAAPAAPWRRRRARRTRMIAAGPATASTAKAMSTSQPWRSIRTRAGAPST